jgi:ankyrin repeat protein
LHRLSSNVWHLTEEDRMVFAGLLLDYGAQINALDSELKSTPLAWAVRYNWPNLVAYLLERGADPNLAGATWATPLAWTHKKDDVDIRQTLEKYGAQQ